MANVKKKAGVTPTKKPGVKKAVAVKKKPVARKTVRPVVHTTPVVDAPCAVGPIAAIRNYFMNYFNFRGTSTRAEYWWVWLFVLIVNLLVAKISAVAVPVVFALLFIPSRTLAFRRFRDAGLSGWLYLVPAVVLFVWGYVRLPLWNALADLEYIAPDMKVFSVLLLLFVLMSFIVFVQPTKRK